MNRIQITKDGSTTIYVPELDETYHSHHGAINEALHVFIQSGLKHLEYLNEIKILEVGFGTGLNCLLSYLNQNKKQKIQYTGIEKYPVELGLIKELNYLEELRANEDAIVFFDHIHAAPWDELTNISPEFQLKKWEIDLKKVDLKNNTYDLIYFDAFGPRSQANMWEENIFIQLANSLSPNGVFVTYSSMGVMKRALKKAGLTVERILGPPGKRHMIRGIKKR